MIDLMPLARFMFDRQLDTYDLTQVQRDGAWADKGIQEFWLAEATAVYFWLQDDAPICPVCSHEL